MKKIFLFLGIVLFAQAGFANMSIYPYAVDFNANSRSRLKSVRIINHANERKTYRLSLVDFEQTSDNRLTESAKEKAWSAKPYLKISPKQFSLNPREVQTINIVRGPTPNLKDGEYNTRLKVSEIDTPKPSETEEASDNQGVSIHLKALHAVTIPVTIAKGELRAEVDIANVKVVDSNTLKVTLSRTGDKSVIGDLSVQNAKEKTIAEIRSVRIYPTLSELSLDIKLPDGEKLKGSKVKVIFKNKEVGKGVSERVVSL